VWQALEEGGYIYVCDDGRRMAPRCATELYRDRTGACEAEAPQCLDELQADERYQQYVFA
jgi:cytochrome P450/NADPH-cytochrome P450 reductase